MGNTHGPQTPVSAIGRGRRGRWWRAAARTAAAAAALRNPVNIPFCLVYQVCTVTTWEEPQTLEDTVRHMNTLLRTLYACTDPIDRRDVDAAVSALHCPLLAVAGARVGE